MTELKINVSESDSVTTAFFHSLVSISQSSMTLKHFSPSFVLLLPLLHQLLQLTTLAHSSLIQLETSLHNFPHHNLSNRLPANINSFTYFSPLSEAEISKLILLLVRFILFHLISFKPFLLQLFLHSLTSLTHPFTLKFSLSI